MVSGMFSIAQQKFVVNIVVDVVLPLFLYLIIMSVLAIQSIEKYVD